MRESFVFYKNFYETIKILPKKQFLIILEAIIEYGLYKKEPIDLPLVLQALFENFKCSIDKAQKRYDSSVKNGKLGGAPKGNKNAEKQPKNNLETTQEQPNSTKNNLNENDNENVNDNVNENDNMLGCFSPTLADILVYSTELGISNDEYCEKFYNHYESIGWVNGTGQKIKNWKLIFNNWVKKDNLKNDDSYVVDTEMIYEDEFGKYRLNEEGKRIVC